MLATDVVLGSIFSDRRPPPGDRTPPGHQAVPELDRRGLLEPSPNSRQSRAGNTGRGSHSRGRVMIHPEPTAVPVVSAPADASPSADASSPEGVYVGIDVAKAKLDVFVDTVGRHFT